MDIAQLLNEKLFLGQEFLTWCWFVSETEPGVSLPDGRQVELLLGDRLILCPAQGQEGTRVTVSGRESSLAEARQSLKRGKLVESIRLGLTVDGEEYWLSLDALTLTPRAVRTPAVAPASEGGREGIDGLILERIALLESLCKAVDGLFERFLGQRLAAAPHMPEGMLAWAAGGEVEA